MSMNVLILTPDRTGSTLLQRLLTFIMNESKQFDKPVVNVFAIYKMLVEYDNILINDNVYTNDLYTQAITDIITKLQKANQYSIIRLSKYNLYRRADKQHDKQRLYDYLNDHFYIISSERTNLFEYAISRCLVQLKKLNNTSDITYKNSKYSQRVNIHKKSLIIYLDYYIEHMKWVETYFHVQDYFNYDVNINNIDNYITNLNILPENNNIWNDIFNMNWLEWNNMHSNNIPKNNSYNKTIERLNTQVNNKLISSNIPVKVTTSIEKEKLVINYDECIDVYNKWLIKNKFNLEQIHHNL